MKVEKSNRRIEITLRYGDPLQPKIKARGYKWDPDKKVWWRGYTDDEMAWAQGQAAGKQEAAARFAERRAGAVRLDASYRKTEPVKDELTALGCFLESTGERVYSQRAGGYVFAKAWHAPADKVERAKAIIQHGGAAKADAAAEARARIDAVNARIREALTAYGLPPDRVQHAALGSWTADLRFGWTTIYSADYSKVLALALHDKRDDSIQVLASQADLDRTISDRLTAEQLPAAQAEASRYGRAATGVRSDIQWRGSVAAKVGDVIHTKTLGWALVVAIRANRVGLRDIEEREDRDDFSGRQTPGMETHATVIPVEPTADEVAAHAEKQAARSIREDAERTARAMTVGVDDDRDRPRAEEEYRIAHERLARLEAGEKAVDILRK